MEGVGNRLADDVAGRVCHPARSVRHRCTTTIPLEQQEPFLVLRVAGEGDEGGGRVLTRDPRRAAQSVLLEECKNQWGESASQSAFSGCGQGAVALWKLVAQHDRRACGLVMLTMANVLEWRRRLSGEEEEKKLPSVLEERCPTCRGQPINSIDHIVDCQRWESERSSAMDEVIARWCGATGIMLARGADMTLRGLVVAIGLVGGGDGRCAITAACFGAFKDVIVLGELRRWG